MKRTDKISVVILKIYNALNEGNIDDYGLFDTTKEEWLDANKVLFFSFFFFFFLFLFSFSFGCFYFPSSFFPSSFLTYKKKTIGFYSLTDGAKLAYQEHPDVSSNMKRLMMVLFSFSLPSLLFPFLFSPLLSFLCLPFY